MCDILNYSSNKEAYFMIKIKNNKFIFENLGFTIPIFDNFMIVRAEGEVDDYEILTIMPPEKDCTITFSSGSTYDIDGKNGLNKKLEEEKDNISVINEQPAEIEINGLEGCSATFFWWTRQVYEIHFDAVNDNEDALVVTVAIDCSRTEENSEWYNMSDEKRCEKAYEKLKKILGRKNIQECIRGIEIV